MGEATLLSEHGHQSCPYWDTTRLARPSRDRVLRVLSHARLPLSHAQMQIPSIVYATSPKQAVHSTSFRLLYASIALQNYVVQREQPSGQGLLLTTRPMMSPGPPDLPTLPWPPLGSVSCPLSEREGDVARHTLAPQDFHSARHARSHSPSNHDRPSQRRGRSQPSQPGPTRSGQLAALRSRAVPTSFTHRSD